MYKFKLKAILCIVCVWAACQTNATAAPVKKDRFYFEKRGEIVWETSTDEQLIALTFDDGPDPYETPQILDLLKQYGAKATFFVVGKQVERYPLLAKREAEEGHELSNHTYSHKYFTNSTKPELMSNEIRMTQETIEKITGQHSLLFRPPGGFYSERIVNIAQQSGLLVVLWSWRHDTRDWSKPGVNRIVNKVLKNAKKGDIILFHDNVRGTTQTVAALSIILPELLVRGYRFVTVSELLAQRKPNPPFLIEPMGTHTIPSTE